MQWYVEEGSIGGKTQRRVIEAVRRVRQEPYRERLVPLRRRGEGVRGRKIVDLQKGGLYDFPSPSLPLSNLTWKYSWALDGSLTS